MSIASTGGARVTAPGNTSPTCAVTALRLVTCAIQPVSSQMWVGGWVCRCGWVGGCGWVCGCGWVHACVRLVWMCVVCVYKWCVHMYVCWGHVLGIFVFVCLHNYVYVLMRREKEQVVYLIFFLLTFDFAIK